MSQDGWLPPGVELSDIPGNRPEDVAWEAASESVKEFEVVSACEDHRQNCQKAQWRECPSCNGTGVYEAHSTDCGKCDGLGVLFDGCKHGIVDANGEIAYDADWSECECWERLVRQWLNN